MSERKYETSGQTCDISDQSCSKAPNVLRSTRVPSVYQYEGGRRLARRSAGEGQSRAGKEQRERKGAKETKRDGVVLHGGSAALRREGERGGGGGMGGTCVGK